MEYDVRRSIEERYGEVQDWLVFYLLCWTSVVKLVAECRGVDAFCGMGRG
jgi:hypothetical protein